MQFLLVYMLEKSTKSNSCEILKLRESILICLSTIVTNSEKNINKPLKHMLINYFLKIMRKWLTFLSIFSVFHKKFPENES